MKTYLKKDIINSLVHLYKNSVSEETLEQIFAEGCIGFSNLDYTKLIDIFINEILLPRRDLNSFIFIEENNIEYLVIIEDAYFKIELNT